ncbi:MAG: class I SAM-dependent methyltransferase [Fimbriimonas sp.]|nr:class I SAM-dependent methyltransferase [Fimbriimonas sp.]
MLVQARWLDPREHAGLPIADSVWIPASELPNRVLELPSKRNVVWIADTGDEARAAQRFLESIGYRVELGTDFVSGERLRTRLWSPSPYLEWIVPQIPPCDSLDLACGSGRDVVFLADRGFSSVGIDHLPDALEMGRRLADRYLDEPERASFIRADLETHEPLRTYGLVTCFSYLDRDLLARIDRFVRPGFWFAMETFTTVHRETFGKPRSDNHILFPGELRGLLDRFDLIHYDEDWHGDRHTARAWVRVLRQDSTT